MIDINMEYDTVRQIISDKVDELFIDRQSAHGIESGDISPLLAHKLDTAMDELADIIARVLDAQALDTDRYTPISPRSEACTYFARRFVQARKEGHDMTCAPPRSVRAWESIIEEWKVTTASPDREPHTPPFMNKGVAWYAVNHISERATTIVAQTATTHESTHIDTDTLAELIAE